MRGGRQGTRLLVGGERLAIQTEVVAVQELSYLEDESGTEQTSQVIGANDGLRPIEYRHRALCRVVTTAVPDAVEG